MGHHNTSEAQLPSHSSPLLMVSPVTFSHLCVWAMNGNYLCECAWLVGVNARPLWYTLSVAICVNPPSSLQDELG